MPAVKKAFIETLCRELAERLGKLGGGVDSTRLGAITTIWLIERFFGDLADVIEHSLIMLHAY